MKIERFIIKEAKRQRLSGYRLAQLTGMPLRTVQGYLAGDHDLSGRRIEKIVAALGLELRFVPRRKAKGR